MMLAWQLSSAVTWLLTTASLAHRIPLQTVKRRAGAQFDGSSLESFAPWRGQDPWGVGTKGTAGQHLPAPAPLLLTEATNFSEVRQSLLNDFDMIYVLEAQVGTPPRPVRFIVDTGSSDLWLTKASYNAASSSTASSVPGSRVMLSYAQGHVAGTEVKDRLCFTELCLPQQAFVSADTVKGIPDTGAFDGVCGLAYPALATARGQTVLQGILDGGHFSQPAFGLALRHEDDPRGSFVVFGDVSEVMEEARQQGRAPSSGTALPVWEFFGQPPQFWMVRGSVHGASGMGDEGKQMDILAVLDSGTSALAVPMQFFGWVLAQVVPRESVGECGLLMGSVACPCGTPVRPLSFSFTGRDGRRLSVALAAKDLLVPLGLQVFTPAGSQPLCRLALQQGPLTMGFWVLGDVFLRRVYAVHDIEAQQVVLFEAPAARDPGAGTGTPLLRMGTDSNPLVATGVLACGLVVSLAACMLLTVRRSLHAQEQPPDSGGYSRL